MLTHSLPQVLSRMYPDYEWLPWKFEYCTRNFWLDVKNIRRYLDWAGKEMGVKEMSDWYNVTYDVRGFCHCNV